MSGFFLTKVRNVPWISLGLFCLTYGVFGWIAAGVFPEWEAWILEHVAQIPGQIAVDQAIAERVSWWFGAGLILSLMIILTAPLRIVRIVFGSWLRSDTKALLSVFGWALAAVMIVCWLNQFARVFVLVSAGMLCNLDLQLCGCRNWQVFLVLSVLSLTSYWLGTYLFGLSPLADIQSLIFAPFVHLVALA
jgi:hypothetical protein